MNWKRIWTGTLLAGVIYFALDFVINGIWLKPTWELVLLSGSIKTVKPYTTLPIIDFGIGFVLIWLYASARPRLGPGPKTALCMGTLAWFLLYVPLAFMQWFWFRLPTNIPITYLVAGLFQCWVSIYLAGWQYIERAP